MITMTPIERWKHDVRFHAIVNNMTNMLEEGLCDYATLQQAAIFASIRHGQIHGMKPCPVAMQFLEKEFDSANNCSEARI